MGKARTVILVAATGAGEAARLAGCSDKSAPPPAARSYSFPSLTSSSPRTPSAPGQPVKPEEVPWQTCPAVTASATFIRRTDRPSETPRLGAIARASLMRGETSATRSRLRPTSAASGLRCCRLTSAPSPARTVLLEVTPEQTETLARARQSGTLWLALRSISDANAKEPASDEPTRKRGESISIIRFGVPSQMTAQK
ncbi:MULTISPECIES: hypothetical protein [unclassified Bradyrhizobium]|jgi:Flp pilus assembly protein CpaB|uniref:hypothetical protein n=1 Tax=unclassified Bradyrhizobium TaxID=2631580 RepID=UPI001E61563C|nr:MULTISPECIES: hypothetical protein [unclassified Bradyrhizobium]